MGNTPQNLITMVKDIVFNNIVSLTESINPRVSFVSSDDGSATRLYLESNNKGCIVGIPLDNTVPLFYEEQNYMCEAFDNIMGSIWRLHANGLTSYERTLLHVLRDYDIVSLAGYEAVWSREANWLFVHLTNNIDNPILVIAKDVENLSDEDCSLCCEYITYILYSVISRRTN